MRLLPLPLCGHTCDETSVTIPELKSLTTWTKQTWPQQINLNPGQICAWNKSVSTVSTVYATENAFYVFNSWFKPSKLYLSKQVVRLGDAWRARQQDASASFQCNNSAGLCLFGVGLLARATAAEVVALVDDDHPERQACHAPRGILARMTPAFEIRIFDWLTGCEKYIRNSHFMNAGASPTGFIHHTSNQGSISCIYCTTASPATSRRSICPLRVLKAAYS